MIEVVEIVTRIMIMLKLSCGRNLTKKGHPKDCRTKKRSSRAH